MNANCLLLSTLAQLALDVAVAEKRIRRIDYQVHQVSLVLTDSTRLRLTTEYEAWIAIRSLMSAAHAGKTAGQAVADERRVTERHAGATAKDEASTLVR